MPLPTEAQHYQGPSGLTRAPSRPAPWRGAPRLEGSGGGRPGGQSEGAAAPRDALLFAPLPRLITFTVDLENPRPTAAGSRLEATTRRLLDMLEEARGLGTFFILGETARQVPALVREIARRGHELASHGQHHRSLTAERPARLRAELAAAKARLEDLGGGAVLGYRAPMFSLTAETAPWAVAVLGELGFAYSSSVLPAWSFLHGFPGAPRRPFLWPGGLLEIPCPLGRLGPLALPFLGGMYLRYLPPWRLRQFARQHPAAGGGVIWSYCHPYDLDAEAGFARFHDRGLGASLMLWLNRRRTAERLAALLAGRESVPFAARLNAIRREAVAGPGSAQDAPRPASAG